MTHYFAGIEAGGTKFVCAVGNSPTDLSAPESFPTTRPEETIQRTLEFLHRQQDRLGPPAAIGIASFGPLDPNPASPTYGQITTTPKPGWASFDFVSAIQAHFNVPILFDTDVNGAALGEWRWGVAQGLETFLYLTIGTGIGGGGLINGHLMHGLIHPEMGHMLIRHDRGRDPYPGTCPYHGDCLEGLACGPAIERRWGQAAVTLPVDHPAWDLEAEYLALGLVNLITCLSPQRIILGGGVMSQPQVFPLVRAKTLALLNGYVQSPVLLEQIDAYIVPPALANRAGVLGAIALAENAYQTAKS
ncbi:MAG: ROK family protein [Anaerolineales bacterium]|jgi:fructokinase|nr:ROK family protein [Anaerolineales bacterium]